ncbi:MAG: hypothetical protein R3293_16720 [Candidatus Promineifilaceae bacterium]|nr:hypothetical protein [Candidatus Promineifilaceae bacterium]
MNKTADPLFTGEIIDDRRNREIEYTFDDQEITFSPEQHTIWSHLYSGIYQPHFLEHFCAEYCAGFELLQLDPHQIPTVAHLNDRIQPRTGWQVERTAVRYTRADDWYDKFNQRIFLITDYLRSRSEIDFTPEPDMFHDIFGHLPYLTLDFYAALEDKFAPAYLKATDAEREVIKRLAWYSTEFGLVVQNNRLKIFGAGLISGRAELANTIMEFYRLDRDGLLDYRQNIFAQLHDLYQAHENQILRIIASVNKLHEQGEMSSPEQGWNVVKSLYKKLGIIDTGYLGGDVLLAPFDIETIALIPKTVYAFNPIFFVFESFTELERLLDSYLKPIAQRRYR